MKQFADLVCNWAALKKNYGLVFIPEGLVESMPDVSALISELNEIMARAPGSTLIRCMEALTGDSRTLCGSLPLDFAYQLILVRDDHGNV